MRAFPVAASQAWNQLPTELKLMRSRPAFKHSLKHSSSRLPTSDQTNLDNVRRLHSSCRRRTKSTADTQGKHRQCTIDSNLFMPGTIEMSDHDVTAGA